METAVMDAPTPTAPVADPWIGTVTADLAVGVAGPNPGRSRTSPTRLTDQQRRLVADNIGLVAVHLRRHVPDAERPSRRRERADLFQEGCLGLVNAALTYRNSSGRIPFPAFALKRIRTYVSRALQHAFETVHIPDAEIDARAQAGRGRVRVHSLCFDPATRPASERHRPDAPQDHQTIGARIRHKYDTAVDRAAADVRRSPRADGWTTAVVDRIVRGRLMIPEQENRVPLREIARATGCPFAKVVYIENRLQQRVRAVLSDDAELAGLRAEARRAGAGVDTPINETVSRRVATAVGARFQRLFRAQSQEGKAVVMLALMKEHGVNVERLATALFDRLTNKDRFNRMCGWFELHTPEHGNP